MTVEVKRSYKGPVLAGTIILGAALALSASRPNVEAVEAPLTPIKGGRPNDPMVPPTRVPLGNPEPFNPNTIYIPDIYRK